MAANTSPIFPLTPNIGLAQVSAANTNRDGTGTIVTVFTAGANGSRVEEAIIEGTGTTTAGVIRVFLHDGANMRLIDEILVPAITPSTTVAVYRATIPSLAGKIIPTGWTLRFSTHNAETFNIVVWGGNY